MLCPGGLFVALGRRADDGRIDDRAFAHASALLFEIARDRSKQALIKTMFDKPAPEALRKPGVRGLLRRAQNRKSAESLPGQKAPRRAARRKDHDQVASNSALNIAKGGQAFSPLAEG